MSTYLHPGVYIEEITGGARPIEAVGTSTAAFVGIAERGPLDEARYITNFDEFVRTYGGYEKNKDIGASYLAYSVSSFFQNGGKACYVVRIEDSAEKAELRLNNEKDDHTLTVKAASPGIWANNLRIAIKQAKTDENGFNMLVLRDKEVIEQHEDLSMCGTSQNFVDLKTQNSLYIRTKSKNLPNNPILKGKPHPTGKVSLQEVKNIRLSIDKFGPHLIDCSAGSAAPASVGLAVIRDNINEAFKNEITEGVASVEASDEGDQLVIKSPTAKEDSQIVLTPPGSEDAMFDIFGLQEYSWMAEGKQESIALVYGLRVPDTGENRELIIALGEGKDAKINIPAKTSIPDVILKINEKLGEIGYTDGEHIVLCSNKDIHIRRPDDLHRKGINALFGKDFYGYVHTGSADNPASFSSEKPVASRVEGALRLTVDASPSFLVKFTGEDTNDKLAESINKSFKRATGGNQEIARVKDDKLLLSSINKGKDGRIIISSHPETDVAEKIFGNGFRKDKDGDDFLFIAEKQNVARLDRKEDIGKEIGEALANKKLRISANSDPVPIEININSNSTIVDLFEIFKTKTKLSHKLLARFTKDKTTIHMIAARLEGQSTLYFSLPLKGDETTAHEMSSDSHAAYVHLFGDQPPFTGRVYERPEYNYRFPLQNNNPKMTAAEEDDFSKALPLTNGHQNRTDRKALMELTLGFGANGASGLKLLDKLTDISLLVIPGWEMMDKDTEKSFIDGGTAYCDKERLNNVRPVQDLFFITNTPKDVITPSQAKDFVRTEIGFRSAGGYAAIYYPWITVNDPIGTTFPNISIPPAGMVAGLYASIDGRRGVWKAPAGTEASVAGIVKLEGDVSDIEQDLLNPLSVNVIRKMAGIGSSVIWGARTLYTNPEWKYISVRRTAIMIEVSIYENIQWAVFEPNDERLWSALRLNIESFMNGLFRTGAFQGSTTREAYFVRCGKDQTMTQGDIDRGQVVVLVGFAPLKPAEFVIVRIQQKVAQQ